MALQGDPPTCKDCGYPEGSHNVECLGGVVEILTRPFVTRVQEIRSILDAHCFCPTCELVRDAHKLGIVDGSPKEVAVGEEEG